MTDKRQSESNIFNLEHAKRDRHVTEQQRRKWADDLLACLPDSIAYRIACTPHARLKEQSLLNQLVNQYQRPKTESANNP